MQIKNINIENSNYPHMLREIYDAPKKLYYAGTLNILKRPCIAIVGTRKCSSYGENQAFKLARELSRQGYCIVSGLAYGIDSAAHKGALEGPGGTAAVVAQSLPEIGPPRNRGLAKRIISSGGVIISEKSPGIPFLKHEYLLRNRIISGLSLGVLVVEAAYRSGALNTANHALDQNRDIMAIPGRTTDKMSGGTNKLIERGAKLISCPKDVADCLYLPWEEPRTEDLCNEERSLFEIIKAKPSTSAELGEKFEGRLKELYSILGQLELKGLVRRTNDLHYTVCGGS